MTDNPIFMSENSLAKKTNLIEFAQIYEKLLNSMPSIGFVNRNKRIRAYIKVTNLAQQMIDNQQITEKDALFILSLMTKKSKVFRKAATMTVLSLDHLDKGVIKAIGFKYVNEMRCNLRVRATDESTLED